jgi:DNA-binding XRE family transcriptional regulator
MSSAFFSRQACYHGEGFGATTVTDLEAEMAVRRTISRHEELRRQSGLTVTGLARKAGFSHAYVSLVEGGRISPSAKYRKRVARCLRVPEELLFPPEEAA